MPETARLLAERVRERVLAGALDLDREPAAAERLARNEVRRHVERTDAGRRVALAEESLLVRDVLAELTGYGPLQPYFDDDGVEEIWINRPDAIFIARDGVAERTGLQLTEREVRDLLDRMLASGGRRIDLSRPFVDASLPDGSRLHAVIPDIVRGHASLNIRKFSRRIRSLARLVELGALSAEAAGFLHAAVVAGANVLVSGATHTGNTTSVQ
ncbi:ATPase, T2SS/T4P/T4SS family [Agromyces seonyuensis]|uniref:Bacterial type II secretion system protein E domain-containing protein n=1 Tax=Agromyces seonyuensis TaxID=2662446 RepID=A0A6I4NXT9_9MICO|nr:ATPase, T2SS/T4P/T4SS family [Agromyces seonyuensis]MWB99068.1 hypothetical protein [Agromyces seonyuensis]